MILNLNSMIIPWFFSKKHYVKSVRFQGYTGPYFPAFRPDTERLVSPYSVQMQENRDHKNSE